MSWIVDNVLDGILNFAANIFFFIINELISYYTGVGENRFSCNRRFGDKFLMTEVRVTNFDSLWILVREVLFLHVKFVP